MPTPSDPLHLENRLLVLAELFEQVAREAQQLAREIRGEEPTRETDGKK